MIVILMTILTTLSSCQRDEEEPAGETEILYTMPEESETHEGTWLQWPHHYQYGKAYRNSLDATWVSITKELFSSEKVHIIAYKQSEKDRIILLLGAENIPLTNIDFKLYKTDDVWIRDNGPIYVRDKNGNLVIQDWGFNGWGDKADYYYCNSIPNKIAVDQGKTLVDITSIMINEGGSVEIDVRNLYENGGMIHCVTQQQPE